MTYTGAFPIHSPMADYAVAYQIDRLPLWLSLTPVSRRPLRLPDATLRYALEAPVPTPSDPPTLRPSDRWTVGPLDR
jgi:hypothetical protein